MKRSEPCPVRRSPWYLGPALDIQPDELSQYESRGGYISQPKVDGIWCSFDFAGQPDGSNLLDSRDARTPPFSAEKAGDLGKLHLGIPKRTILIGEHESGTQWATKQAVQRGFSCLYLHDVVRLGLEDLRGRPWASRQEILVDLARTWESDGFVAKRLPILPYVAESFRSFHELWLNQGYEGSVLKDKQSLALTSRVDGKTDSWARCKALTTEDYVFMGIGWTPGGKNSSPKMTGRWGLYANGKLQFAMQAGVPEEYLREENIGALVVEFKGQYVMDSGAIRHARFHRLRTDKDPKSCVFKK